jgi:excisionase family DNA binding protein
MAERMNEARQGWMSLRAASEFASVSEATLRREAKSGRLRGYKIGGRRVWRFRAEHVSQWLEGPTPEPAYPSARPSVGSAK